MIGQLNGVDIDIVNNTRLAYRAHTYRGRGHKSIDINRLSELDRDTANPSSSTIVPSQFWILTKHTWKRIPHRGTPDI